MFNNPNALLDTLIIGAPAYLVIIFLLRISGKRTLSKWNAFDFVVTIAFGSILSTLLLSKDTSLLQGALAVGLLVFFQYAITWISVRSNVMQKLLKAEPSLLLYQGQLQHSILKRERVAKGEVLAAIRSSGIAAIEEVEAVVLETDGSFSVIPKFNSESRSALADVKYLPTAN
ncbi:DUF421 domain-containing protein [Lusitaniella coriacea LEGE 07157]|uniref:DUF421 domain-containing protein n=1 Tax=Lusitaniella coriacea LEGE 07157 TaxID=945747 RepID=A0A8J7J342_9CYAN|nr:YetF domain-containing protein [Lusitaniella coriacea]MBE9116749.1 DUF421 domain-containing protein [Lusitaniella coriacea LEGE 07157]